MVAPPELDPLCISAGMDVKVYMLMCLFVCLQSTRRKGESTKGATLAPYCPTTNPTGRVEIMTLDT